MRKTAWTVVLILGLAWMGCHRAPKDHKLEWTNKLFMAVKHGNTANVHTFLHKLGDPDVRNVRKRTPLMVACENKQKTIATMLLDAGADPNAKDQKQHTPLWEASRGGDLDLVDLLLKRGAKVGRLYDAPMSPLWEAVRGKHTDVVKRLIEEASKGTYAPEEGTTVVTVDPNQASAGLLGFLRKQKPIMTYSVGQQSPIVIYQVLENGKRVKTYNLQGQTAPMRVSRSSHKLIKASAKGDLAKILKELDKGVNPNRRDVDGRTALIWAAIEGHPDVVDALVQHKADMNILDHYGVNALMYAANRGYFDIVKSLVENGADVNMKDKNNATVLIWAADRDRVDILSYLVKAGVDIHAADRWGTTALMVAIFKNHRASAFYLVSAGADLHRKNASGFDAKAIALKVGNSKLAKSLGHVVPAGT